MLIYLYTCIAHSPRAKGSGKQVIRKGYREGASVNAGDTRRRKAEECQPIVHGTIGQALTGRRAFMTTPAPVTQVVVSPEEFQKVLRHTLVDIEEGAQAALKPSMALEAR